MSDTLIHKIASYSTDVKISNALLALLDYCDKDNLRSVSDNEALEFLARLESGEIEIAKYKFTR